MRHLPILLFLAITGCYFPSTPGPAPDRPLSGPRYGGQWAGEELRATVWFDEHTGLASFDINQPAHVALFAFRPLGGIEMIYPTWGRADRAFHVGQHSVRTESRLYQLVSRRSIHGRSVYDRRYGASGQTYIVLIASRRPLEVQKFLATGTLPWLDHPSVTWNPFLATDRLAREIVPRQASGDWTAAYHVIWPHAALARYDGRIPYTTVRCPGDVVISIPIQVLRSGAWSCPERDPRSADTARAKPRAPSTPITETLPRRPRPVGWAGPEAGKERPAIPTSTPDPGPKDRGRGWAEGPGVKPAPEPTAKPWTESGVRSRPTAPPSVRPTPKAPNRAVPSKAVPKPRPAPKPKAVPRPSPAPKPKAVPKPSPAPKPKPKPKPGGG